MRQIIASAFVSLDGVMQAPAGRTKTGSGGFRFGGAGQPPTGMTPRGNDGQIFLAVRSAAGAHLRHFRRLLAADHRRADPVSADYRPRVQSGHLRRHPPRRDAGVANSQWLGRDILAHGCARAETRAGAPVLLVQGSSTLMQQLANDLVDELRLSSPTGAARRRQTLFDDNARRRPSRWPNRWSCPAA
ncbi:dihydrofolate reductase [Serratia ureilytica]